VYAKQKIYVGLKYKGPFGGKGKDLMKLPAGSKVLVYRPKTKSWDTFGFVELDGDTVNVQGKTAWKLFRSNVV
jgi:hypothetical protein